VVFVLDGLLLLVMLCGSRLVFRLLRSVLPHSGATSGSRALIYGAGDGGEILLQEIRNNPRMQCVPIGFADDDPRKKGKRIHGLQVFGGNGAFVSICRKHRIKVVLLSSTRFPEQRIQEIRRVCEAEGVSLKRMRIVVEEVDDFSAPELGLLPQGPD
jgi:UDP-GlcNAc:undecaprenyl-phosphate GlcNAc-1-phosphate transferase